MIGAEIRIRDSCRRSAVVHVPARFRRRCLLGDNPALKVSEILRLLADDGWRLVAIRGSHRQYKHFAKRGRVTVPGKPSDELAPATLRSIRKQAGWK
jgi:predicted RNA binding protein YcfA (HicA-like mRNA interferase family)